MRRPGREFAIDGVRAFYRAHELDAMRALAHATDYGADPESVHAQLRLMHGLKVALGAVLVDDIEEASIRRCWQAADDRREGVIAA